MDRVWEVCGLIALTIAVGLGVTAILAPKVVDGYYISRAATQDSGVTCVYSHWSWHQDEKAFCSTNYQEVLDFYLAVGPVKEGK